MVWCSPRSKSLICARSDQHRLINVCLQQRLCGDLSLFIDSRVADVFISHGLIGFGLISSENSFMIFGDLKSSRVIVAKGFLFLVAGLMAAGILIAEQPSLRNIALLITCIWCFCRFYYFAFYVVQHYVDPGYRFAGLGSFVRYLWQRSRS